MGVVQWTDAAPESESTRFRCRHVRLAVVSRRHPGTSLDRRDVAVGIGVPVQIMVRISHNRSIRQRRRLRLNLGWALATIIVLDSLLAVICILRRDLQLIVFFRVASDRLRGLGGRRRLPYTGRLAQDPQNLRTHIQARTEYQSQIAQRHPRLFAPGGSIDQLRYSSQQVSVDGGQARDEVGKGSEERCRGRAQASEVGHREGGQRRRLPQSWAITRPRRQPWASRANTDPIQWTLFRLARGVLCNHGGFEIRIQGVGQDRLRHCEMGRSVVLPLHKRLPAATYVRAGRP